MRITELFYSLQGEGLLAGVPSVFVRVAGCHLHCRWCDTPYSSWAPEGEERSVDDIVKQVEAHPTRFCVLTGGEPMLAPELPELAARLGAAGKHVTIETAATRPPGGIVCDLASLSPKLANAAPGDEVAPAVRARHERLRLNLEAARAWVEAYAYQLKFVIQTARDVDDVRAWLAALERDVPPERVLLMPEGRTAAEVEAHAPVVLAACRQHGFRFCDRLQLRLFGNQRGT